MKIIGNAFDKQRYVNVVSGFYFDKVDDYIEITPLFNMSLNDWSISFFVKPISLLNSTGDSNQDVLLPIIGQGWNGDSTFSWRCHYRTDVRGYRFAMSSDPDLIVPALVSLKDSYGVNEWQHVVLEKSGNNFTIYVGGVKGTTSTIAIFDSPAPIRIGRFGGGVTNCWAEMQMANLSIYDRVLTHAERDELYRLHGVVPESAYSNCQLYLPLQYNSFKASFNSDDIVAVSTTTAVNQIAHGFSVGDLIYLDGTYKIAEGLNPTRYSIPARLVTAVADADNFTFNTSGVVNIVAHGYGLAGEYLYCSPDGRLVNEETGHAVGYVVDADNFKLTDNLYPYAESSTCQFNVDKDFADKVESESLYRVYGKTLDGVGVSYYGYQNSHKDFYTGLPYVATEAVFSFNDIIQSSGHDFSYAAHNLPYSMVWRQKGTTVGNANTDRVRTIFALRRRNGIAVEVRTQNLVGVGSINTITLRILDQTSAFYVASTFNFPPLLVTDTALKDKKWHNWVITHTVTGSFLASFSLYLDGVLLSTINVNYSSKTYATDLNQFFFNSNPVPPSNFLGNITLENVFVYDKILSLSEIQELNSSNNYATISGLRNGVIFNNFKGTIFELVNQEPFFASTITAVTYNFPDILEQSSGYPISWQGIKLQELNPLNDLTNLKYIQLVNTNFPVENGLSSDEFTFVISGDFDIPPLFTNLKRTSIFGVFDLNGTDYDTTTSFELSLKSDAVSPTADNVDLDLDWSDVASLTTLSSEDTGSKVAEYNTLAIRFKKLTSNTAELSIWSNGLKLESQTIYLDNSNTPNVTTQDYSLNKVGQTTFLGAGSKVDVGDADLIRYSNAVYSTFGYWKSALSDIELKHLHNNSLVSNPKYLPADDSYLHNFNTNLLQYFVFNKENIYFDGVNVRVRNLATSGATFDATVVGLGTLDDVLNNYLIVR